MKKLASSDVAEQQQAQLLADQMLEQKCGKSFSEHDELTVKTNRTVINRYKDDSNISAEQVSQGINVAVATVSLAP